MLPELRTEVPGPRSVEMSRRLAAVECGNITYRSERFPVFWDRAQGVNVWDVDANRFLDLTSAFGVSSLGFAPPAVVEAMREQAGRLYHAMGDVHPAAEKTELCERLSQLTFERWTAGRHRGKSILTTSGAEAVEAALKTAYLATGRRGVVAFTGSYHGLGYGALTVTEQPFFRVPFASQLADFATFLPYPSADEGAAATRLAELRQQLAQECGARPIGAIIVEPILGRGGKVVPPEGFLPLLREVATQCGALLILDEIFTGFYRSGPRFAVEADGVVPDLICLGKALTSGFPLAACVGRDEVMDAWPLSRGEAIHTTTFLGNPLGCRMALAALTALEQEDWEGIVKARGQHLRQGLEALAPGHAACGEVRGRGLMWGLDILSAEGSPDRAGAGQLVEEMLARGFLILSSGRHGHTLSFTPPFIITNEEIDAGMAALAQALALLPGR
jgi:4-aminobutyrate aminotransferase-like enzyme